MPRETLDRKIKSLLDGMLELNQMVESATRESVEALRQHDLEAAKKVYANDQRINAKRFELENACLTTIATQQPIMAKDLRLLASILEVVGELERIGDYAKGIARVCLLLGKQPHVDQSEEISRMSALTISMLHRAVEAFISKDINTAGLIPWEDDKVDALYNKVYQDLISTMLNDDTTIDEANFLMWAAHNLERMADRVTNICERTIYAATGVMKEIDSSDDEIQKYVKYG